MTKQPLFYITNKAKITSEDLAKKFICEYYIVHFGNVSSDGRAEWRMYELVRDENGNDTFDLSGLSATGSINLISNYAHVNDCERLNKIIDDYEWPETVEDLIVSLLEKRGDDFLLFREPTIPFYSNPKF